MSLMAPSVSVCLSATILIFELSMVLSGPDANSCPSAAWQAPSKSAQTSASCGRNLPSVVPITPPVGSSFRCASSPALW